MGHGTFTFCEKTLQITTEITYALWTAHIGSAKVHLHLWDCPRTWNVHTVCLNNLYCFSSSPSSFESPEFVTKHRGVNQVTLYQYRMWYSTICTGCLSKVTLNFLGSFGYELSNFATKHYNSYLVSTKIPPVLGNSTFHFNFGKKTEFPNRISLPRTKVQKISTIITQTHQMS